MNRFDQMDEVWEFMDNIPKFQDSGATAANFSFDHLLQFLDRIGNPHRKLSAIHIAGTNGKGTTGYLLEKVFQEAGYVTGLFTSPHLLKYNERIRISGEEIPDKDLLLFFREWGDLFEEIWLSYFEISTVIAFWYFDRYEADLAILETGLGGRLDSTNVIQPLLSIITSVGMDHQDILGETLEDIAREKAGIIKKDTPVILGNMPEEAFQVCSQYASEMGASLTNAKSVEPEWNKGVITLTNPAFSMDTSFKESVNKWNVAMVYQAVDILKDKYPVSDNVFKRSVEDFRGAPGRFEKLGPEFEWYFSGSHNSEALKSSLEAIKQLNSPEDAVVIFSAMRDKVSPEFLDHFRDFDRLYFVEQKSERAAKFVDIRKEIKAEQMDENNALNILNELKSELVIFMGSFYFYPIVKRWTKNVSQ